MQMGIKETRQRALKSLIDRRFGGVQSKFGSAIGRQSDYVSRLVTGKKALGEKLAREIELQLGLERGELDRETPILSDGVAPLPSVRLTGSTVPVVDWESLEDFLGNRNANMVAIPVLHYAPRPTGVSEQAVAVQVQGFAMEPEFRDGWLAYIDTGKAVKHGDYVVAKPAGRKVPMLRQLIVEGGTRYLRALNPQHPENLVVLDEEGSVIGRVVYQGKSY
jgi:hypothetical protein